MPPLPGGTVTFLLTDVEQSTRLWEQFPDQMRAALTRHDALGKTCITQQGGTLVKERGEGDSLFATFTQATDGLDAAIAFQNALIAEDWPPETPLRVRMALHTGEVEVRDGDYYGTTVNRCGRIRSTAHGGQILISQAIAEIVRDTLPSDITLRDLGQHRLKDLQRPERLMQVLHPALPSDFPPLRSLDVAKHNLPRQLTSFIGRDKEIRKVRSLLDKTCLLTLTGSGGSGKTRLALQVTAELADTCPDGVWLVELAPLPEKAAPDVIAKAIAAALHIKEQAGQETLTTLSETLAEKSLLLLLDNCEHVEHSCRIVVDALLRACPGLRVLATSRHNLSVQGETLYPVSSLSLPPKNALLTPADALEYESLRLFVERAQSASPQFALTASNLPHVAQICSCLDGIPLAIELAAARVSAMKVIKDIADHLDHAFRFLKAPGVVERHQTLLKTIEWSYALLTDAEKILLRRLSVFVGGWTLEACEAVCAWGDVDHWEVVDLLTRLVQTSLVTMQDDRQDDREAPTQADGASEEARERPSRYYLLETLRQFGQEKLEEFGETDQARNRHLEYLLALAEQAEPELTGPHQAQWLERLETDHDNFRTALKWATDGETRLRLACALWSFWSMRSYFSEGSSWLSGALARAHHATPALRAKALNGLGVFAMSESRCQEARPLLEESLQLRREIGDENDIASSLNTLANMLRDQNRLEEAEALYLESIALRRRLQDRHGMAGTLNNLGILARDRSDLVQARTCFEESLQIFTEVGDQSKIGATMVNLGVVCQVQGDSKGAKRFYTQALDIYAALRNRWVTAIILNNLANIAKEQQNYPLALCYFAECLQTSLEVDDMGRVAITLFDIAYTWLLCGQYEDAAILMRYVDTLNQSLGISLTPEQQTEYLDFISKTEAAISPYAREQASIRGMTLSLKSAVDFALRQGGDA